MYSPEPVVPVRPARPKGRKVYPCQLTVRLIVRVAVSPEPPPAKGCNSQSSFGPRWLRALTCKLKGHSRRVFCLLILVAQKRRCPAGIRRPEKPVPPRHKRAKKTNACRRKTHNSTYGSMAGTCFATFRSGGPQPPAAEARKINRSRDCCVPRRLRPARWRRNLCLTIRLKLNCQTSGQNGRSPSISPPIVRFLFLRFERIAAINPTRPDMQK